MGVTLFKEKPLVGSTYPDNGGYIGFSVFVWDDIRLSAEWGGTSCAILEARFFVFGQLFEHIWLAHEREAVLINERQRIISAWRPIMDDIVSIEHFLQLNLESHGEDGIYISEIMSPDMIERLSVATLPFVPGCDK